MVNPNQSMAPMQSTAPMQSGSPPMMSPQIMSSAPPMQTKAPPMQSKAPQAMPQDVRSAAPNNAPAPVNSTGIQMEAPSFDLMGGPRPPKRPLPPVSKPILPMPSLGIPKAEAAAPSPLGDMKKNIDNWRKIQSDTEVADKAYDLDPDFRDRVDYFATRMGEMDEDTKKNLPTLLLNQQYYGSFQPEYESLDPIQLALESELADRARNPQKGFFSSMWDATQAPGNLMAGVMFKGLDAVGFDRMGQTREARDLGRNANIVKENLPNYGAVIGSAFGPMGTAAGTAIGRGAANMFDEISGERKTDDSFLGMAQMAKDVAGPVFEGAIAGTLDKVTMGASKWIGKTPLAKATKKYLTEKIPARLMNSSLKTPGKELSFGKDPGKAVVDEKITAATRGGLLNRIMSRKNQIGEALDAKIAASSTGRNKPQIDMAKSIITPIKDAMQEASRIGDKKLNNALADLLDSLTKNALKDKSGRIVGFGKDKGLVQTVDGVWDIKKAIGDSIVWTEDALEKKLNKVMLKIYHGLRDDIVKAVPGTDELMRRYSGMIGAEKSLGHNIAMSQKNNIGSVGDIFAGSAGLLGGSLAGGVMGVMSAASAIALRRAAGSTASKTLAAQALSKGLPKLSPQLRQMLPRLTASERSILLQYFILSGEDEDGQETQE